MPTAAASTKLIETLKNNWNTEMGGFYVYSHLAERETDGARRRALRGLASAEKHHADLWADRLHALGSEVPRFAPAREAEVQDSSPSALRELELDESRDIAKYGASLRKGDQASTVIA